MPTTTAKTKKSGTVGDMIPRPPIVEHLTDSLAQLRQIDISGMSQEQAAIVNGLINETRTHLAAIVMSADSEHRKRIEAVRTAVAEGSDLGPSLSLEEFDRTFPG